MEGHRYFNGRNIRMPKIYDYFNFRDFIRDFYIENKSLDKSFSFQIFADRAGFKSKSFIKLVIDGKKNLTVESIKKINNVLKLSSKAFSYFSLLVKFNQAPTLKDRDTYFRKLISYNKRNPARIVLKEKYEFYSQWYHNTIRELVTMENFNGNYERIAKMVRPAITAGQVKESIKLLERLKLIKRVKDKYIQTDSIITTGNEIRAHAVENFHKQNLKLASESINTTPSIHRDISCVVLGLSDDGFKKLKGEIQQFRKKLLQIANEDKDLNRVYHVNLQLYPTSKTVERGKS